ARRIRIDPSPKRVRAMANGRTVADSLAALLLLETGHRPVYYFPRADVRTELLAASNHRTHCPYKGDASYWTLKAGDHAVENAAWSYETPIDDVARAYMEPLPDCPRIKAHVAFYPEKVDQLEVEGGAVTS